MFEELKTTQCRFKHTPERAAFDTHPCAVSKQMPQIGEDVVVG
jgi:hypothetical protein